MFNWVHFAVINMNIDRDRTDSRVWALGNKRDCGIAQRADMPPPELDLPFRLSLRESVISETTSFSRIDTDYE